jgi:hypothetical protein
MLFALLHARSCVADKIRTTNVKIAVSAVPSAKKRIFTAPITPPRSKADLADQVFKETL